jgi:hypothetical protein
MASTKNDYYVVYAPLPPNPTAQNVVVLPYYHPTPRRRRLIRHCLIGSTCLLLLSLSIYFLYPYDPTIQLARVRLNRVRVNSSPKLTLDLSFSLTVKVHNRDFFSLDYDALDVSVGYRGRELGFVSSQGGRVRARASSYVNATLDLDGLVVIHDVFYLLEDLAKGVIPFETDTQVNGVLGLFFFKIPLKVYIIIQSMLHLIYIYLLCFL